MKEIYRKLREKGHEISYDWTKLNIQRPFSLSDQKYSQKIIRAIEDSDVFILISDSGGTDMYGELVAAIKSNELNGMSQPYVIGDYLNNSIFFFHPVVKRRVTIEEVLADFD